MPHVVLEGGLSAARAHAELALFEQREGVVVRKLRESFLSRSGRMALFEAVVVEGVSRRFVIAVEDHPGSVTVRLYPLTDVEKTDGVKRLVAEVAARLKRLDPQARVARTNLGPELERCQAGEAVP